jgi:hypothetical protein
MSEKVVQNISVVVLAAVAALVLLGLLRLALAHWTFWFLVAAVAIGAWYLGNSATKENKR